MREIINKYYVFEILAFATVLLLATAVVTCDPFAGKCLAQNVGEVQQIKSIPPTEFKQAVDSGEYKLIDIRTVQEYYEGHLANASQADFYQSVLFENYLDSLDKNDKYLIYCRTGNRTGEALEIMRAKGFKNVSDLDGGIVAWAQNGLPIVK